MTEKELMEIQELMEGLKKNKWVSLIAHAPYLAKCDYPKQRAKRALLVFERELESNQSIFNREEFNNSYDRMLFFFDVMASTNENVGEYIFQLLLKGNIEHGLTKKNISEEYRLILEKENEMCDASIKQIKEVLNEEDTKTIEYIDKEIMEGSTDYSFWVA